MAAHLCQYASSRTDKAQVHVCGICSLLYQVRCHTASGAARSCAAACVMFTTSLQMKEQEEDTKRKASELAKAAQEVRHLRLCPNVRVCVL